MLCPSCQHNVPDNTAFCPTCGHKFSAAQEPRKQIVTPVSAPDSVTYGKMTFGGSVKSCFSRYCDFEGRASKAEYWYWVLFTFVAGFGCGLFTAGVLTPIVSLATFLPGLAVVTRRLHDSDHSGWNQLWSLTGIGAFYVLYLLLKPTGTERNKYGPVAPRQ